MDQYYKIVKPIIKKSIRNFRSKISHSLYDDEDLIQEGYIAAISALNKWSTSDQRRTANIASWAKRHIDNHFSSLSEKTYLPQEYIEEVNEEIPEDDIETFMDNYFETRDDDTEIDISMLSNSIPPKYVCFLHMLMENNISQSTVAQVSGKSRARISQIKKMLISHLSGHFKGH